MQAVGVADETVALVYGLTFSATGALSGLSLLLAYDLSNTCLTILIAIGFVIGLIVGAVSRWHFQ